MAQLTLKEKNAFAKRQVEIDPEYFTRWQRQFTLDLADWFTLDNFQPSKDQTKYIEEIYEKAKRR